jgi:hypothetical protein
LPESWHSSPVPIARDQASCAFEGVRLVEADVVAEEHRYRHDPAKLAATIMRMYDSRDTLSLEAAQQRADEPLLVPR